MYVVPKLCGSMIIGSKPQTPCNPISTLVKGWGRGELIQLDNIATDDVTIVCGCHAKKEWALGCQHNTACLHSGYEPHLSITTIKHKHWTYALTSLVPHHRWIKRHSQYRLVTNKNVVCVVPKLSALCLLASTPNPLAVWSAHQHWLLYNDNMQGVWTCAPQRYRQLKAVSCRQPYCISNKTGLWNSPIFVVVKLSRNWVGNNFKVVGSLSCEVTNLQLNDYWYSSIIMLISCNLYDNCIFVGIFRGPIETCYAGIWDPSWSWYMMRHSSACASSDILRWKVS